MINYRKQHRKEQQLAKFKNDTQGTGSYLFANNTKGDFYLPRPTKEGKKIIKIGEQFVGDSYYFSLLKSGELRLVKEVNDAKTTEKKFVFQNRSRDDLPLSHPTKSGLTIVPPLGEFVGDESYFEMMRAGKLKLIKEVDETMSEKLITEVPPTVTREGVVEYVKEDETQFNEQKKKDQQKKEEATLEGVKLLLD